MADNRTQLNRFAKQSEVRVRSSARLVGLFILMGAGAAMFEAWALTKLSGAFAAFFAVVALAEFLNARRRRAQANATEIAK